MHYLLCLISVQSLTIADRNGEPEFCIYTTLVDTYAFEAKMVDVSFSKQFKRRFTFLAQFVKWLVVWDNTLPIARIFYP